MMSISSDKLKKLCEDVKAWTTKDYIEFYNKARESEYIYSCNCEEKKGKK